MLSVKEIKDRLFQINKTEFPSRQMLGAVAVLGKSCYFGNNTFKTHPQMIKKYRNGQESSCCHAELSALQKVPRQSRSNVDIYVIRFQKNGNPSMSMPCPLCQRFLIDNDVRNVYYTNWDGDWQKMRL